MKRSLTILPTLLLVPLAALHAADGQPAKPTAKPNIILILVDDIGEKQDLAKDKPDLVAKLHQSWLDWSATLPPRANPQPAKPD